MTKLTKEERQKLKNKLKAKIGEKNIYRKNKKTKEQILNTTMKQLGLDYNKLKADIIAVKKQGGYLKK